MQPGHPFCLANRQDCMRAAMLDMSKIEGVYCDLRSILGKVPKTLDWCNAMEKEHLAADALHNITQLVTRDTPYQVPAPFQTEGTIDSLIEWFRNHTKTLGTAWSQYRHAERLARLIECSLMQVQEHIQGGDRTASAAVC